ncbi:chemotaxis protein CheW [Rhodothermus sp. AH-315-K08]|nr:chemotaxis protein CheW [Rhodothermus sp. AH-315-K08]
MTERKQYCTFYVDNLFFGIDVLKVQEIIRNQEMAPVPLAPPVISGLINLRGQVVTAMDLRQRLGLKPAEEGHLPLNVIINGEDTVSFLVDEIGDVIQPELDSFELPPETIEGQVRAVISGVHKLDDRLMLVMDADKTMELQTAA